MSYWVLEFVRVFFGYIILMYFWPSVVFRKKLSGKSLTFRFAFCSTVSVLLINTLVLGLGLLHILKGWVVFLVFYGILFLSVFKEKAFRKYFFSLGKNFFTGALGWKSLILQVAEGIKNSSVSFFRRINRKIKGRRLEFSVLSILLIFAVTYFSYGAFQNHSYGWGDMYVHHSWIYGLKEGNIFSEGVYPEAMHCFIYCMDVLFGIPVYSSLLFLGEIHVTALLVAVFCLLREVMKSKYTVYVILTAFLTLDVVCVDEIYGISRLQYTIPQEFGLYTQFLCVLYLIRFLNADKRSQASGERSTKRWKLKVPIARLRSDSASEQTANQIANVRLTRQNKDDLFLFMTALAASLAIHFYVTIMAFFLCAAFALWKLSSIFQKENFRGLVGAVILGVVVSTLPMVLAFASGIPLQGSLNWGMNIINGTDTKEGRAQLAQKLEETETEQQPVTENDELQSELSELIPAKDGSTQAQSSTEVKKRVSVKDIVNKLIDSAKRTSQYGYVQLYGRLRAAWILWFTLIATVITILNLAVRRLRHQKKSSQLYAGITFASVLFMVLYAAPYLGLPEIIAGARLCLTEQILILAMMAIPVDELFFRFENSAAGCYAPYLGLFSVMAIYAGTNYFGVFHGYLYYELTRYNSAVELTNYISGKYPRYTYTIISTTEELYQAIETGRHEEILDFYYKSKSENYYIPTEYLFFYIEKNPIQYAQYHFFEGPRWLAQDKYTQYYKYSNAVLSVGDQIEHGKISERYLNEPLAIMGKASDAYSNITNRNILESEMYYWCQNFETIFPNEIKVYYEDEDLICYVVKQNPDHLFNLGT